MKRLSPLIVIAVAAAAAVAFLRNAGNTEEAEDWKPVQPS